MNAEDAKDAEKRRGLLLYKNYLCVTLHSLRPLRSNINHIGKMNFFEYISTFLKVCCKKVIGKKNCSTTNTL